MFTEIEAIEAISARINGEWDNKQLLKIGALTPDTLGDIAHILNNVNRFKITELNPQ